MRRISFFFLAIVLALLPSAPSFDAAAAQSDAQNKPPAPQPTHTFKSRTELVLVPVVVHNGHEEHIPGLSKNDFIVQENGVEQKISIFEEVRTSTGPVHRAGAPGVFTNALNRAPGGGTEATTPRLNIICLDTLNTAFLDQSRARQDLIKFLAKTVERGELTSLLTLDRGGVHVVHDFTTDSSVLVAALKRVKGKVDAMSGENADAMNNNADVGFDLSVQHETQDIQDFMEAKSARIMQGFAIQATLDGLATIARVFGGIPGRKALIWVTGSFPFIVSSPNDPPYARGYEDDMARSFQLLNDANISVYPVDARGLVIGLPDASTKIRYNPRNPAGNITAGLAANSARLDTLRAFAAETGGRAFVNSNDLEGAFRKAAEDSASYYLLGYYRDSSNNKPGWRRLKVKVHTEDAHVRTRAGYFVNPPEKNADVNKEEQADFRMAVSSPMDFTGVIFAVRFKDIVPAAANKTVNFDLTIDRDALWVDDGNSNHMKFSVLALARNSAGENAGHIMQTVDGNLKPETLAEIRRNGLGYHGALDVPPGQYTVRFIVKDELSGRIGTVSAPLTVN